MRISPCKTIASVLCCLLIILSPLSRAQDISIEYASGRDREAMYLVDISLRLELDDEILNALQHGVSLEVDVELQIRQERKWLWDKLLKETMLRYRLEHHPLSDDYVVTNVNAGAREQFQTLDEALNHLGSIRNIPVIETEFVSGDDICRGYVKAELNIEELPPPLKPIAYVSTEWHLESQWYEWIIR